VVQKYFQIFPNPLLFSLKECCKKKKKLYEKKGKEEIKKPI
jgi:hypothetical protein